MDLPISDPLYAVHPNTLEEMIEEHLHSQSHPVFAESTAVVNEHVKCLLKEHLQGLADGTIPTAEDEARFTELAKQFQTHMSEVTQAEHMMANEAAVKSGSLESDGWIYHDGSAHNESLSNSYVYNNNSVKASPSSRSPNGNQRMFTLDLSRAFNDNEFEAPSYEAAPKYHDWAKQPADDAEAGPRSPKGKGRMYMLDLTSPADDNAFKAPSDETISDYSNGIKQPVDDTEVGARSPKGKGRIIEVDDNASQASSNGEIPDYYNCIKQPAEDSDFRTRSPKGKERMIEVDPFDPDYFDPNYFNPNYFAPNYFAPNYYVDDNASQASSTESLTDEFETLVIDRSNDYEGPSSRYPMGYELMPDLDNDSVGSPASSLSSAPEAFPEYQEPDENEPSVVDEKYVEAYEHAFAKVGEERVHEVILAELMEAEERDAQEERADQQKEEELEDDDDGSSTQRGDSPQEAINIPLANSLNGAVLSHNDNYRLNVLQEIKIILGNRKINPEVRKRFVAMSNMIISMRKILFGRRDATLYDPSQFLSAQDTAQVGVMAVEMLKYLWWLDRNIAGQVEDSQRTIFFLSYILNDRSVSAYTAYKRMVTIVTSYVKKPLHIEERLLIVFLDLYDAYVYTSFLSMSNRQGYLEQEFNIERMEISRLLIAIWDVHNRIIENYAQLIKYITFMKDEYLDPCFEELATNPEVLQALLDNRPILFNPDVPEPPKAPYGGPFYGYQQ